MSGSRPHALPGPAIVAADPTRPVVPCLVISDLLRTHHCIPGSIFLVEGIEAHIPISKRYRTVRLLLGDGDLCIQALVRPEMHRFVDHGDVYVGCYVQLNRFEIHSIPTPQLDQSGDDAAAAAAATIPGVPKVKEEMVFLVVRDMATVGWNTVYMQMAGATAPEHQGPEDKVQLELQAESTVVEEETVVRINKNSTTAPLALATSPPALEKINEAHAPPDATSMVKQRADGEQAKEAQIQQPPPLPRAGSHPSYLTNNNSLLPWAASSSYSSSDDLSKPLKLTPLKNIPNLPYKQNWVVNILAIVASLSDAEAASLPPYRQRVARLADPSTSKQVHLTVFLDPDDFNPEVGSVVLLLGVKNHRFDGGSLKKYGSEKPKGGSRWWFENPKDIAWCDVDGLRSWWSGK